MLKKKTENGSQVQWFGKMNFSLPYMAAYQRQKNRILVLNPECQSDIPFWTRFKRESVSFFKECVLNWWTFLWLVLNLVSFCFFIGCLVLKPVTKDCKLNVLQANVKC